MNKTRLCALWCTSWRTRARRDAHFLNRAILLPFRINRLPVILSTMDHFLSYLCFHAANAHYFIFGLLLLTGANVPISEDLLLIAGGVLVALCVPGNEYVMIGWMWAGCVLSAYEAYWLGRWLGPRVYTLPIIRHYISPKRVEKLNHSYERFGLLTFLICRFLPFGLRNALFMTSGMGGMPFTKFALRDGFAAIVSTSVLFALGHAFGSNYETLLMYIKTYEHIVAVIGILVIVVAIVIYYRVRLTRTL